MVTVVELGLEDRPERFLLGVVEAHPGTPDRQAHLEAFRRLGELGRGALAAPVGAEDRLPRVAVAEGDGLAHRVFDQVGVQTVTERVAEHPPGTPVAHRAQVQPALASGQIGDVRGSDPVQRPGVESALDQVGNPARPGVAGGGDRGEWARTDPVDVVVGHDLRDGLAGDLLAAGA